MQKLTQEEFQKRVYENSKGLYEVVSEYQGKNNKVKLRCKKHNCEFEKTADAVMRRSYTSCPECKLEETNKNRLKVVCSYCGVEFFKPPSKKLNSRSGLFFCCREHKDIGQSKQFGLKEIWPEHYDSGNGVSSYRNNAFIKYGKKCAHCGYEENERLIDVHHIDSNRDNNILENLIPLCVMCHAKVTRGISKIEDRQLIDIDQ